MKFVREEPGGKVKSFGNRPGGIPHYESQLAPKSMIKSAGIFPNPKGIASSSPGLRRSAVLGPAAQSKERHCFPGPRGAQSKTRWRRWPGVNVGKSASPRRESQTQEQFRLVAKRRGNRFF